MISVENQQNILINIAKELKKEITAYAIGGTAMMLQGIKNSTIDIDLVFTTLKDREEFIKAAKKIGWTYLDSKILYGEKNSIPVILRLVDERLDLFVNEVIDFIFSNSMQERAKIKKQFNENLILKIADVHDIIIMKCSTKRMKDKDDITKLIQNFEINWDILINETQNQVRLGKETAILSLGNLLEELKNKHNTNIPENVLERLWRMLKKQAEKKAKK